MTVLRQRLRRARAAASRGLGEWRWHCLDARQVFGIIAAISCAHVTAPCGVDQLELAVDTCRRLLVAAQGIDALARLDAG